MFSLLSGLYTYMTRKEEYYILIVGLDNSGKTTLLEKVKQILKPKYKGVPAEKITPTVGLNVATIEYSGSNFVFWDLGGQRDLQTLWKNYYEECHGLVFVIDSCDAARLQESKEAFDMIVAQPMLKGVPLLVWCNKQDKDRAMPTADIKQVLNEAAPRLGLRDCKVQGVSGFTGENISTGIEWMKQAVHRNVARPPAVRDVD
eukprot:m.77766 g.77766  ORF g.77766 m.77766 type:complete len:202 (+) comp14720_c0_seq3:176-781(+)